MQCHLKMNVFNYYKKKKKLISVTKQFTCNFENCHQMFCDVNINE